MIFILSPKKTKITAFGTEENGAVSTALRSSLPYQNPFIRNPSLSLSLSLSRYIFVIVERGSMASCELAEDLMIDILSRLPVKSLLRFKCVCKSWCDLIESPNFIAKHLNQSNNNNNGKATLLVKRQRNRDDDHTFCLLSGEAFQHQVSVHLDYFPYFEQTPRYFNPDYFPNFGLDHRYINLVMLGYCNGIIFLHDRCRKGLALWNPATREFRVLPESNIFPPGEQFSSLELGFGYDFKANDYKVVRIVSYICVEGDREWVDHQVEVYSLGTDSWRLIDHVLPDSVLVRDSFRTQTLLNGIYSWWAQGLLNKEEEMVLSFDISDELFQTTPLPDVCADDSYYERRRTLAVLNESIALILSTYGPERCYQIWVLNEFGVKDSWSKLYNFGPILGCSWPLGFCKNGELLLPCSVEGQLREQLVLFDPVTQEPKNLQVDGAGRSLEVIVYEESLVCIKGGNGPARRITE